MTRTAGRVATLTALLAAAGLAVAAGSLTGPSGRPGGISIAALVEAVSALLPESGEPEPGQTATTPSGPTPKTAMQTSSARPGADAGSASAPGGDTDGTAEHNDPPNEGDPAEAGRTPGWWLDPETGNMYGPDGDGLEETFGLFGNGESLAGLLQALAAAGPDGRARAAEAFVAAAASSGMDEVMAAALPGLYDFDPVVRYYSLVALGASALGSTGNAEMLADAVPYILGRLADDEAAVREAAAAALATIQPAPPTWTAGPLTAALADADSRVVAAAQAALELVGPADAYTLEIVSADLYSEDAALRSRAVRTLGAVAGDTEAGLSLLIWSLGDADAGVRWQAATSLGEIGPAAIEATFDLANMAGDADEDPDVRDAAATALASIAQ